MIDSVSEWVFTFVVCGALITTAYWNVHWGIVPFQ
jgi:hypothetical protein